MREVDNVNSVNLLPDARGHYGRCPQPVGIVKNRRTGATFFKGCGRWDCPYCGWVKKMMLLDDVKSGQDNLKYDAEVARLLSSGWRWVFLTLTLRVGSPNDIMYCWNGFRAALRWHGVNKFYYFVARERQGGEHLHIVMLLPFIPQSTLSKMWLGVTGDSFRVDIRCVRSLRNAAGYMFKYVTKQFEHEFGRYAHRFSFSRNWPRPNLLLRKLKAAHSRHNWQFIYSPTVSLELRDLANRLHVIGKSIIPSRNLFAKAFDEPDDFGLHPPLWVRYQKGDFSYLDWLDRRRAITKQATLASGFAVIGHIKYKRVRSRIVQKRKRR